MQGRAGLSRGAAPRPNPAPRSAGHLAGRTIVHNVGTSQNQRQSVLTWNRELMRHASNSRPACSVRHAAKKTDETGLRCCSLVIGEPSELFAAGLTVGAVAEAIVNGLWDDVSQKSRDECA